MTGNLESLRLPSMDFHFAIAVGFILLFPVAITIAYFRRRRAKARYYANPGNEGAIEGSVDELNQQNPSASPWRNDEVLRLNDTMDVIGRFDTMRGYSDQYVEDLKTLLRENGIACESIFLEGYPVGAVASLTMRMGIFELYADRTQLERAEQVVKEFQSR